MKTSMEDIIKLAIEAGWKPKGAPEFLELRMSGSVAVFITRYLDGGYNSIDYRKEEIVCDRTFWKSLNQACGWKTFTLEDGTQSNRVFDDGRNWIETWKGYALKFMEINLTEGWDAAIEYLSTLITTKK